jgi:hypothetical protein
MTDQLTASPFNSSRRLTMLKEVDEAGFDSALSWGREVDFSI